MISVTLLMFANSMFSTLLALRANIENYSNEMVGLMASAYFFGFALGTFRSGPLINRIGHIRTFAALSAIACAPLAMATDDPDPNQPTGRKKKDGAGDFLQQLLDDDRVTSRRIA